MDDIWELDIQLVEEKYEEVEKIYFARNSG